MLVNHCVGQVGSDSLLRYMLARSRHQLLERRDEHLRLIALLNDAGVGLIAIDVRAERQSIDGDDAQGGVLALEKLREICLIARRLHRRLHERPRACVPNVDILAFAAGLQEQVAGFRRWRQLSPQDAGQLQILGLLGLRQGANSFFNDFRTMPSDRGGDTQIHRVVWDVQRAPRQPVRIPLLRVVPVSISQSNDQSGGLARGHQSAQHEFRSVATTGQRLVDGVDSRMGLGGARVRQGEHGGNKLPGEIRRKFVIREGLGRRIDNGPGVFSVKFGPTDDGGGRNFLVLVLQEITQRSLSNTSVAAPVGLGGRSA